MTGITGLSSIAATRPAMLDAAAGAPALAAGAVRTLGDRVAGWVAGLAPGGPGLGQADQAALAAGGDIYGLGPLGGAIAERLGATPAQEGELGRALQDFTRAAMVEAGGLHGGTDTVRAAGLDAAETAALAAQGDGIDGVIAGLSAATGALVQRHG